MTNKRGELMSPDPAQVVSKDWENLLNKITKNLNEICTKILTNVLYYTNIVYLWISTIKGVFEGGCFQIIFLTLNTYVSLPQCHGLKCTSPTVEIYIIDIPSDHQAYLTQIQNQLLLTKLGQQQAAFHRWYISYFLCSLANFSTCIIQMHSKIIVGVL